jgi:hypothetical protein
VHVSYAKAWNTPNRIITFLADDAATIPDVIVGELLKN